MEKEKLYTVLPDLSDGDLESERFVTASETRFRVLEG